MYVHRLRVGVGADGKPVAWRQTIVGQSIAEGTPFASMMLKNGVDDTSVEGVADSPYVKGTPNHLVDLHSPKKVIPVLWLRSVGHSHTAFVMETFVDELAHAAGQDPLEYRRRLLSEHPRGLAVHESFGSWMAQVAEVSVASGRVCVHRVVCAVDCGICVNPAGVRAQVEGAVAFGLSAALHGELTFKDGRVQQSNFHDYPILRLNEMPDVEVHIVPSSEKAGGIGEVGVPPVAPAVANAVFSATGKRLRRLPFRLA
jgi:isoquinoline 1-oxidoreductase beta subunit